MSFNSRAVILDALLEINEKKEFTGVVLSKALENCIAEKKEDRAFIQTVVKGSIERQITIDYIINSVSKTKINKMKPVIRNILRMSVYQICFMEGAQYAACDEAVKLACKRGFLGLKGFVNGVLRNIARLENPLDISGLGGSELLSVKYSIPVWIVELWLEKYGKDKTISILKAQFFKRKTTIRCNTSKIKPEELVSKLSSHNFICSRDEEIPEAIYLSGYDCLEAIPEFNEGLFYIQDISSMRVAHIAAPTPGDYIIDVCAAPGGKSLHLAEMLNGTGCVEARDISESKTRLIDESIERLGLTNIRTKIRDARTEDEENYEKADMVICDLPCSGLGIIGKKPDIKYNSSKEGCRDLVLLQREILKMASKMVKPGGKLVYSTCTLNPEENGMNASWIEENLPFRRVFEKEYFPTQTNDGFFISLFEKRE